MEHRPVRSIDVDAHLGGHRLRVSSDLEPGIARLGRPGAFRYRDADGGPVPSEDLARIRSLVIPPAWTDVWICADGAGHLQATGRDARGRKQYRYHPRYRQRRERAKFGQLPHFGAALGALRAQVKSDLARAGLPRERVLAAVVRLLDRTRIRVGNREYAEANGSYGLTTLHNRHVVVKSGGCSFRFRGKSGKWHEVDVDDSDVLTVVRRCRELPGQALFEYRDESGAIGCVTSADVNEYIHAATGAPFTSKDFRTWAATVIAAEHLRCAEDAASAAERGQRVVDAVRAAAEALGNTVAVCRASYVHPGVIDAYEDGRVIVLPARASRGLSRPELGTLQLLAGTETRAGRSAA